MDKQKQIEEMAKDMHEGHIEICDNTFFDDCPKNCHICNAKAFYERGYRKIPENAVVLTREELEQIKGFSREEVDEISETAIKNSRKETAEKFAERVKMAFYYEFDEIIPSIMAKDIDEIAKEITEGK